MTPRDRIIQIIDDWADGPDCLENWDSVLKVNVLIQVMKEFGIDINSADIPGITGMTSLMAYLEPRLPGKKVLVLDCDGVLWDGLAGEETDVVTPLHENFQESVSALEEHGALVCLCSKNNEADVVKAIKALRFAHRPYKPLELSQIVAMEISWDSKVDSLRRLAAKLNLGLDSFVFVDNGDAEIEEVRQALPEVHCLKFNPRQWQDTAEYLKSIFPKEGRSRTLDYVNAMQARKAQAVEPYDQQAFLDSLNMVAEMRINDESLATRIAELSQKTNQFNMTLSRETAEGIKIKIGFGVHRIFCASLKDRFGYAGWVAMAVFYHTDAAWVLQDFCVSCRVIGRGFERAFIEKCMERLRLSKLESFQFNYVAGPKNSVCSNFFDGQKVSEHVPIAPVRWKSAAQPSP